MAQIYFASAVNKVSILHFSVGSCFRSLLEREAYGNEGGFGGIVLYVHWVVR